jgi:hypothetical protein
LFRRWHDKDHALREFVRRAAHITEQHALSASLVEALDRFTDRAGAALYLPAPDGCFRLAAGSLAAVPALLDPDAAERDRLHRCPTACRMSALAGLGRDQAVFPMNHRGRLNGLVVVGPRMDGETYRPDECAVMSFAAQQVGLDLDTLRIEQLERRLNVLQAEADGQEAALRLLAGRRAALRGAISAATPQTSEAAHIAHGR